MEQPPVLTAEFIDETREIAEQRVVAASYRLAELLNRLFAEKRGD